MSIEAVAQRAAQRNAIIAERQARVRALKAQEISHILRLNAAELAARVAVCRARHTSESRRTSQAGLRQGTKNQSAPCLTSAITTPSSCPDRYDEHYAVLKRRNLEESVEGMRISLACMWHPRPQTDPLELYRPPPVRIPGEGKLVYIS